MQTYLAKMKLDLVYPKAGLFVYLHGSLFFLFSLYYAESSPLGLFFLALGLLLLLADSILFLLLRPASSAALSYWMAWALGLCSLVLFLAYFFLDMPVQKLEGAELSLHGRLRRLLLFLFVFAYSAAIICRLMLSLAHGVEAQDARALRKQRQSYLQNSIVSTLFVFFLVIFVNYLTYLRNPFWDLSPGYVSFSEDARKLIQTIDSQLEIHAFLPEIQAVKLRESSITPPALYKISPELRLHLEQLPALNPKISLHFYNADLEAYESNEFPNIRNGVIVCRKPVKESSGLDPYDKPYVEKKVYVNSEKDLQTLERNLTKALLYIAAPKKKIYFTEANGEPFSLSGPQSRTDGMEHLKEQLRFYNLELKALNHTTNWPGPIPKDADALAIIGPRVAFGKKAQDAVLNYVRQGGALFAAAGPDSSEDFSWLLLQMGTGKYRMMKKPLTNTNFSGLLLTNHYQKHSITESIKNVAANNVLLLQHSYFEEKSIGNANTAKQALPSKAGNFSNKKDRQEAGDKQKQDKTKKNQSEGKQAVQDSKKQEKKQEKLKELEAQVLLYSPFNSYVDSNRNSRKDAREKSKRRILALAYAKPETHRGPKVIVYAGAHWLSQRAILFPIAHRNLLLASDSFFWLLESPLSATLAAKERPLRNVQVSEELKWRLLLFGVFLFPITLALALTAGLYYYRRRHRLFMTKQP